MDELVISASMLGCTALEKLQETCRGQAIGQTSGGVYLRTEAGQVLFLSVAAWHGPLTINLPPVARDNLQINLHSSFLNQESAIYFPKEHLSIEFDPAECWSPPSRPAQLLPLADRLQRYRQVQEAVNASLADRSGPERVSIANQKSILVPGWSGLMALQTNLASRNPDEIIPALADYMGRGPGLTPAGDDLVQGFLLALNRWGDRLCPEMLPDSINQGLIKTARQRTTALSASLIECAARGLADERLILALDGLLSDDLAVDRIVEYLQSWGHTSGAAALQGMGLVLA